MQIGAQPKKKIISAFDPALVGFAQPIFSDQVRCREYSFFEIRHPKQILVIAQSATAAFDVGLLHINAATEFFMPRLLIAHTELKVFAFRAHHAFCPELLTKFLRQRAIAREKARFEHRGLREHVAICLRQRFFNRTRRMPDFETDVP